MHSHRHAHTNTHGCTHTYTHTLNFPLLYSDSCCSLPCDIWFILVVFCCCQAHHALEIKCPTCWWDQSASITWYPECYWLTQAGRNLIGKKICRKSEQCSLENGSVKTVKLRTVMPEIWIAKLRTTEVQTPVHTNLHITFTHTHIVTTCVVCHRHYHIVLSTLNRVLCVNLPPAGVPVILYLLLLPGSPLWGSTPPAVWHLLFDSGGGL